VIVAFPALFLAVVAVGMLGIRSSTKVSSEREGRREPVR
jgi:hypothetical protein